MLEKALRLKVRAVPEFSFVRSRSLINDWCEVKALTISPYQPVAYGTQDIDSKLNMSIIDLDCDPNIWLGLSCLLTWSCGGGRGSRILPRQHPHRSCISQNSIY